MPRFRAEKAIQKVDPLVQHGRKVTLSYSNERAFETRRIKHTTGKYREDKYEVTRSRLPSQELLDWLDKNSGPRGVLWTAVKHSGGIDIFFAVPGQAMMFKLTWGGL